MFHFDGYPLDMQRQLAEQWLEQIGQAADGLATAEEAGRGAAA